MGQTLRPYQSESLDRLRDGIKQGCKAQILMAPVGSGKTTVASAIKQGANAKGKKAFFIVDSLELVDQAAARFLEDGMQVGVIQGQHHMTDYAAPIQVATIQTLKRRWPEMPESLKPDLIIIDEAHVLHSAHEELITWAAERRVPVIGLSATPFRKGLGKVFDRMVVSVTTADLIEQGYLCPARCYAPSVPDLKGVKTAADGDWQADALAEVMGDHDLMGDVVDQWLKLGEGRQTIVFAANVAHSRALCDRFRLVGINAAHIDGYETDKQARADIIRRYRAGDIQVITNCQCLTKGFDAPETSCIVLARPTKSLMMHIQMIGRGLRQAEGKTDGCVVIDHAGNCVRNGLPDAALPQELDDGSNKRNPDRPQQDPKQPTQRACMSCGHVSTQHVCPACGFKPEARRDVEVKEGELYELTEQEPKEKWPPERLAQLYAELKKYANQRGYNEGWAWHKCREYAGKAPRNTKEIAPRAVSDETKRVVKHLQIRAAKRREKVAA